MSSTYLYLPLSFSPFDVKLYFYWVSGPRLKKTQDILRISSTKN